LIEAIERTDDPGGRAGLGRAGGNGGALSVGYHAYLTISSRVPNDANPIFEWRWSESGATRLTAGELVSAQFVQFERRELC
jgi:hypothetical protein